MGLELNNFQIAKSLKTNLNGLSNCDTTHHRSCLGADSG